MSHRRTQLVPVLALLLAASPWAQLDLPGKPKKQPVSPESELLPPAAQRGDLATKPVAPLELPGNPKAGAEAAAVPVAAGPAEAARQVLLALGRERELAKAAPAVETLLNLGPSVVPVARAELGSKQPVALLAAARVCLIGGDSADRAAVAERMTRALPGEIAVALLTELQTRDPMLASPEYLAGLLDHPTSSMRTAAAAALGARLESLPLSALVAPLDSSRSATRSAVLELLANSSDPVAWNLVATRLGDPSAQLARRAADLLASRDALEPMLLERAFPPEARLGVLEWDRARAYALLALVQREESSARPLLDTLALDGTPLAAPALDARIEALRGGLTSAQPLVAGACAVALARTGFRSGPSRAGAWLDREVPHQLVRCGTGAEFHADFSSLERPALRALALISGQSFGSDGDAWRRWWIENAHDFHARHAVIELVAGSSLALKVSFRDASGRSWSLFGPECALPTDGRAGARLDADAAERLQALLETTGVFGAQRTSNAAGAATDCDLAVAVGDQEKRFLAGRGGQTWLDELRPELERLLDENRWQFYFDRTSTTAGEWWQAQHERWAAMAPLERRRALVELLLLGTRPLSGAARDERIAELVRLYQDAGVPAASDFEPLLALLAGENVFGPRAENLCELARVALGASGAEAPEAEPRGRLLRFVLEHFGPEADEDLARVARDLDADALRQLAAGSEARGRALSAEGLVRTDGCEPELRRLLVDPDPSVSHAVLVALASNPLSLARARELRPELLERAHSSSPDARATALSVLSRLGGKDVNDLALEAVGDPDPSVQLAGVEALAQLAEPSSASLLASLLARGPGSPLFAAARRGLARLGTAGTDECLRLARSSSARARREAILLLSERLAPEAAGLLLALQTETPGDERVLWELAVLSGLDLPTETHPEQASKSWWDLVVHDDPLAWLLAAAERAGVPGPSRASLVDEAGMPRMTAVGGEFLLRVAELPAPQLVERAARELENRLGIEFHRPDGSSQRARFVEEMREALHARLGE